MTEIPKSSDLSIKPETILKTMSRAHVKLKEIEQDVQYTQDRFEHIKKRLDRMKNICEERALINSSRFANSPTNSSNCIISSIQESYRSSTTASNNTLSVRENFYEDTRKFYSYTSKTSSTKSIVINNSAGSAIFKDEFQTENFTENKIPSVTEIETKMFTAKLLNNFKKNNEEKTSTSTDDSSSSSHNLDHSNDFEPQEIFKPFPPTPKSDKKSQLILKMNATRKATSKQKKTKKFDKTKKNLSYANFIIHKQSQLNKVREHNRPMITRRVRKLKLKKPSLDHFKSKSKVFINVVANSRKKFKQVFKHRKENNSLLKTNTKNTETIKILNKHNSTPDVVELYHNSATNNATPSVESSKHDIEIQNKISHEDLSQNPSSMKYIQNQEVNASPINLNYVHSPQEKLSQSDLKGQLSEAGNKDSFPRKKESPDEPQAEDHHHHHRHENCHSRSLRSYGDELVRTVRNYQQPTIASKLKKVDKCYVTTKFDLENIPFVVGTSITPSHNIGLNVQQVMSSLKTKQHQITADFQHELINKTGKNFNSVIQSLLKTSNLNANDFHTNSIIKSESLVYSNEIKETDNSAIKVEQFNEPEEIKQKKQSVIHNMKNLSTDMKITKSENFSTNYQNFSSSGTFENAMRKINDRYIILNEKYEYLHDQLLQTNNKKIKKELNQVKNELTEKEEEIHAIVGLYLEVVALKRQMKTRHNSSLLYISTKCSTHNSTKINSPTTTRPHNSHSLHITEYQQRKTPISKKMQPNSKVFAGLLRNIQSLQNQLTTI